MKPARIFALASLLALAACSGSDKDPAPTPSARTFTFEVAGQYGANATLKDGATQSFLLTVGKPLTTAEQKKADRPAFCPNANGKQDQYIPMHLQILNTSPASAPKAQIGASISVALDTTQLGQAYAVGIQDDDREQCSVVIPLKDVTAAPFVEDYLASPLEIWSPPRRPTKNGENMQMSLHLVVSGGPNAAPPPLSAVYLRLSALVSPAPKVSYTITDAQAIQQPARQGEPIGGNAGVMTGGSEKGAFYVPIDPKADPCKTIGKGKPMTCSHKLTAP